MPITIKTNSLDISRWLDSVVADQIPWCMQKTVNALAFNTRQAVIDKMGAAFQAPTPWTLKTPRVDKAKTKVNPSARMWINDEGQSQRVITHQFAGSHRVSRKLEGYLFSQGHLKPGQQMVPGPGCPLDGYGNPQTAFLKAMMKYIRDNKTTVKQSKLAAGSVTYFISPGPPTVKFAAGIWMRVKYSVGSAIKPVFFFVTTKSYRQLLDVEAIGRRELEVGGQKILDANLQKALEQKLSDGE